MRSPFDWFPHIPSLEPPLSTSPAEYQPAFAAHELRVRRQVTDRGAVLRVSGEVDLASVDVLRTEIRAALESSPPEVWIDLCDTAFIDSSGLHALVETAHEVRGLAIICPPGPVRRVFELTGLDRALPLYDDAEALLRSAQ